MAEWNKNNLACLNVWSILFIMKQHQEVFKRAGDIKMGDLLFYNPTLTQDELKFEAIGIADFLDRAFVNTCGANYDNSDQEKAIENMASVLINADSSISDLAEKVDVDYEF